MSRHQPFKPSFGGKVIVLGCSDNYGKANLQEWKPGPKVTTYQRTGAALEAYWDARSAAGSMSTGDRVPGGEKQLAYKTREACWKDSVHLEHNVQSVLPIWQGTPSDIEDKEKIRTRGIPGFTGKQPPMGQSNPPQLAPNTSGWVAINAFDQPKPRVKGIVGYTGHQPPKSTARLQHQQQQLVDSQHQLHQMDPQVRAAWCDQSSSSNTGGSNSALCTSLNTGSTAVPGCLVSAHATAERHYNRPGSNASEASTVCSPRFFLNGVEVPPDGVQVPPSACCSTTAVWQASAAAAAVPVQHQLLQHQQAPQGFQLDNRVAGGGPPRPQAVWGVPVDSSIPATEIRPDSKGSCAAASCIQGAAAGHVSQQCIQCTGCDSQAQQQQKQQSSSIPRRTRATTYAAAFSEASGFGIQRYMESLQLAAKMRPASAYDGCSTCNQQCQHFRPG